jgi:hypothetical protein
LPSNQYCGEKPFGSLGERLADPRRARPLDRIDQPAPPHGCVEIGRQVRSMGKIAGELSVRSGDIGNLNDVILKKSFQPFRSV